MRSARFVWSAVWSLALLCPPIAAVSAAAQGADSAQSGTISGSVVAAETGDPLPGADVTLAPAPYGVFGGRGGFWRETISTTTGPAGRYRFAHVAPGRYTIRVRRLGYRPSSVDVDFDARRAFEISVGLVVAPIVLEAMRVTAPGAVAYRSLTDGGRSDRAAIERLRQERFIPSDVHVLTSQDVSEAVTLGESDLFRALQRVPGVSTRDDYTAELWTRGAPWDQTRVYFDGLPLFNPVHAVGAFSGVDPDAVGSAIFEPGMRSAAWGGGAAGAIELTSRAAESGRFGGAAALSAVSARATAGQRFAGGRGGWMVAARRSYVDLVTAALQGLGDDSAYIPYAFTDLVTRLEIPLGAGAGIEASALLERDDVRGNVPDILVRSRGHWGNGAARATLVTDLGGVTMRTTVGGSRFSGSILPIVPSIDSSLTLDVTADSSLPGTVDSTTTAPDSSTAPPTATVPDHGLTTNDVSYLTAETRLQWGDVAGGPAWRIGAGVERFRQYYRGPEEAPYPDVPTYDSLTAAGGTTLAALWAERRLAVGSFAAELGARLEAGSDLSEVGRWRLAPRISARYRVANGATTVSAAYGRTFQYVQSVAPAGPAIGPELHLTDVWLAAGGGAPTIRADIATVGIEHWLGPEWLVSANAYLRRATGVAVPVPAPGPLFYDRPLYSSGINRARGVELALRRFGGPWTIGVSYTRAASRISADGYDFPAVNDRREVLDATLSAKVSGALRLGAAVTLASGAPFTRNVVGPAVCTASRCSTIAIEAPNAERAPSYAAASVMLEWTVRHASWDMNAFVQVRNVLPSRSAVTYAGTVACSVAQPPFRTDPGTGFCDEFHRGLPVLPLAGVRVAF